MIGGTGQTYYAELLEKFTEEELFTLAGLPPVPHYITNPYREDSHPRCFFKRKSDYLLFFDYTGFFGKKWINCFEALEISYNKKGDKLLKEIYSKRKPSLKTKKITKDKHSNIEIRITVKPWVLDPYFKILNIEEKILYKEGVFLVEDYWTTTSRDKNLVINRFHNPATTTTIGYVFKNKHIKLYFPEMNNFRFYSNCVPEDIWGITSVKSDPLIITKSGKDYLTLKYPLGINVIALQCENDPVTKPLYNLITERNKKGLVTKILFDNDDAGKEYARRLSKALNIPTIFFDKYKDAFATLVNKGLTETQKIVKSMI